MKRLLCLLIFVFLLPVYGLTENSAGDTLIVHFLDIGQGDAAIIQCGDQTLMIDGGDTEGNQFLYEIGGSC